MIDIGEVYVENILATPTANDQQRLLTWWKLCCLYLQVMRQEKWKPFTGDFWPCKKKHNRWFMTQGRADLSDRRDVVEKETTTSGDEDYKCSVLQIRFQPHLSSSCSRFWPTVIQPDHSKTFPVLSSLARDYLASSASCRASEKMFSSVANLCSSGSESLKPWTIERCEIFRRLKKSSRMMLIPLKKLLKNIL
ncbi:hypothetical protein VP01_82g5 [Puccinia sorghi]|uniref:HAT C-terminal dimerisation domain-containing protein n=1 Tax=Puccinia sorghi TaxID=27349 RepID=A0A0L6U9Q2_9BASI|nr:hypothetical protein VP01_82g5 [Puccinia sorghi]